MGNCCNGLQEEVAKNISECQTISEIAYTMKYKAEEIANENKEIDKLIANPTYVPSIDSIKNISHEHLQKRSIYLTQLKKCYIQSSEILAIKPQLNIFTVKEHMKDIIELDSYLFDDCDNYIKYWHAFLKYVQEEEGNYNTSLNDSEAKHKRVFDNIIFYDELSLDSISQTNSKMNLSSY